MLLLGITWFLMRYVLVTDFASFHKNSENIFVILNINIQGHLIKNPSTQRAKSLLAIPCGHRIIISGTPLQNNLKVCIFILFHFEFELYNNFILLLF